MLGSHRWRGFRRSRLAHRLRLLFFGHRRGGLDLVQSFFQRAESIFQSLVFLATLRELAAKPGNLHTELLGFLHQLLRMSVAPRDLLAKRGDSVREDRDLAIAGGRIWRKIRRRR